MSYQTRSLSVGYYINGLKEIPTKKAAPLMFKTGEYLDTF